MHICACLVVNYLLTYLPTYRTYFCISEQGGEGIFFTPLISMCSHGVLQVPKLFPKDSNSTSDFYPIQFAQSSTLMDIK